MVFISCLNAWLQLHLQVLQSRSQPFTPLQAVYQTTQAGLGQSTVVSAPMICAWFDNRCMFGQVQVTDIVMCETLWTVAGGHWWGPI